MFPKGRPYSRFRAPHGREGGPGARGAYLSNYRELGQTTYVLVSAVVRCTTMGAGSSIRQLLFFCEIFDSSFSNLQQPPIWPPLPIGERENGSRGKHENILSSL